MAARLDSGGHRPTTAPDDHCRGVDRERRLSRQHIDFVRSELKIRPFCPRLRNVLHTSFHLPRGNLVRTGYQGGRRCPGRLHCGVQLSESIAKTRARRCVRPARIVTPDRAHRRRGEDTGGARETAPHIVKLRGSASCPASRLLPRWERSLTVARCESRRGNGRACREPA